MAGNKNHLWYTISTLLVLIILFFVLFMIFPLKENQEELSIIKEFVDPDIIAVIDEDPIDENPVLILEADQSNLVASEADSLVDSQKQVGDSDLDNLVPDNGLKEQDLLAGPSQDKYDDRLVLQVHKVQTGDWFSSITAKYWSDPYLWPDLYNLNDMLTDDPDMIYPGELVKIYQSLNADGVLTPAEKQTIIKAYLRVYTVFRRIGPQKDNSRAHLIYAATRFDKDFMTKYANVLDGQDIERALRLRDESKLLD